MASAKFAKSTVNQSQIAICNWKPIPGAPVNRSRTRNTVVSAAPISTTNMTGFLASVMGLSLAKEARLARLTISGSKSGRARLRFFGIRDVVSETGGGDVSILVPKQEMLDDGTERKRGEEGQRADDEDGSDQQSDKERAVGGKSS